MAPLLDERSRRRWAASEAVMIGRGGVSTVAQATGLARRTVYRGLEDLNDRASAKSDRIRQPGGGRKSKITEDPTLLADLKALIEPATGGDPMRRQLWTSLSLRKICEELKGKGHEVSYPVVGDCIIAFRPTANPTKAISIWIGMPSSNTSTTRLGAF
jgi:transposase